MGGNPSVKEKSKRSSREVFFVYFQFKGWLEYSDRRGMKLLEAGVYRARIFKHLCSPGIDAKASIPPAYVAWRAGTITLFLLGA
jgi:hypothetical protein